MRLVEILICPSCAVEFSLKEVAISRSEDIVTCECPQDKNSWRERIYFMPDVGNIINHKLRVVDFDELPALDMEIERKKNNDRG